MLIALVKKYPDNVIVADAVISNLKDREQAFATQVLAVNSNQKMAIHAQLKQVLTHIAYTKKNKSEILLQKEFPRGVVLFQSTCRPCHGADGNGVKSLAPPLNHSEWVTGNKDKLVSIVLFGLTGPVKVNAITYQAPEISGDMPGIGHNKDLVDEDIVQLLSYIRNSWSNTADKVTSDDIARIRQKYKGRQKAFTAEELEKLN